MSSIEDVQGVMTIMHPLLLSEIDAFLSKTGMSPTYFGKAAVGNSELVRRLRGGGRVWPETEAKIRSFILTREKYARAGKRVSSTEDIQGEPRKRFPRHA